MRDPAVKQILPDLGKMKNAINEEAKRMPGWPPLVERAVHRRHS
jgi:hypothetical protein